VKRKATPSQTRQQWQKARSWKAPGPPLLARNITSTGYNAFLDPMVYSAINSTDGAHQRHTINKAKSLEDSFGEFTGTRGG